MADKYSMKRSYLSFFMFVVCTQSVWGLEPTYATGDNFDIPRREQSIIATDEGYYPRHLSLFSGEKVLFFFTTTSDTPSCLLIPDKDVSISVTKGKVTEAQAIFDSPGQYRFYCPTRKLEGRITVLERPEDVRERKRRRDLASERINIWVPRDDIRRNEDIKSYD
jgi:plastocyanin